jgi:hypothetical protein
MKPDQCFKNKSYILLTGMIILYLAGNFSACSKEYSFEGGGTPAIDTLPPPPVPKPELPVCPACANYTDPVNLNQWTFNVKQSKACGTTDTAIINLERTAFTFFGPSTCSADTGLVMTVYLENESLNRDITNLTINRVAFYYYDRVTPSYIYMSNHNSPFTVHVDSYQHQTKILTGTFTGNTLKADNSPASITSGKFKVKLL